MEGKHHCSICGGYNHNKRTCPNKPIDDISKRQDTFIHEEIIYEKKEQFITDLLEKESYDIPDDIFIHWLQGKKPTRLAEIQYIMNRGLNKDSIKLYLTMVPSIEELY
jgi:hypothetical protein